MLFPRGSQNLLEEKSLLDITQTSAAQASHYTERTKCAGLALCNDSFHKVQASIYFFYVHMTVRRNKLLINETNRRTSFQIYSCTKFYVDLG